MAAKVPASTVMAPPSPNWCVGGKGGRVCAGGRGQGSQLTWYGWQPRCRHQQSWRHPPPTGAWVCLGEGMCGWKGVGLSTNVVWMAGAGINGHGATLSQLVRWSCGGKGDVGVERGGMAGAGAAGVVIVPSPQRWVLGGGAGGTGKGIGLSIDVVWVAGAGITVMAPSS